jgi:hypothetical protein
MERAMAAEWHPFEVAGGAVRVWLPAGERLRDLDGVAYWSPDPELGQFSVASGEDGDGDRLLAAERAGADVDLEEDERAERGGLGVRHLRYRTRRLTPRVVIDRGSAGPMHTGGEVVEHLADVLLLRPAGRLVRVGYSVRADAPDELRRTFAQVLERVRVGSED